MFTIPIRSTRVVMGEGVLQSLCDIGYGSPETASLDEVCEGVRHTTIPAQDVLPIISADRTVVHFTNRLPSHGTQEGVLS
jgi:hypothetical protein